jgi:hypothetical protein
MKSNKDKWLWGIGGYILGDMISEQTRRDAYRQGYLKAKLEANEDTQSEANSTSIYYPPMTVLDVFVIITSIIFPFIIEPLILIGLFYKFYHKLPQDWSWISKVGAITGIGLFVPCVFVFALFRLLYFIKEKKRRKRWMRKK